MFFYPVTEASDHTLKLLGLAFVNMRDLLEPVFRRDPLVLDQIIHKTCDSA
jgi:hypothetical protein